MIAVIKGDIAASRKLVNQEQWMEPLEKLFKQWGDYPTHWEIVWGDFFQLEVEKAPEALQKALQIKALIRSIEAENTAGNTSRIDVRMAIGIGEKNYMGKRVSQSNGSAFVFAGDRFNALQKEKVNLMVGSPWPDFDREMNLILRLAGVIMDRWSVSSAQLMKLVLNKPTITQEEMGKLLGIKQNSVSGRYQRATASEVLAVEKLFKEKVKKLM